MLYAPEVCFEKSQRARELPLSSLLFSSLLFSYLISSHYSSIILKMNSENLQFRIFLERSDFQAKKILFKREHLKRIFEVSN